MKATHALNIELDSATIRAGVTDLAIQTSIKANYIATDGSGGTFSVKDVVLTKDEAKEFLGLFDRIFDRVTRKSRVSVYKRFDGKRLTNARDKNWSRGTWYVWKRIRGRVIHRALPEARTQADAENAERKLVADAFNRRYGVLDDTLFADFANTTYLNYCRQKNANYKAKDLYVRILVAEFGSTPLLDITPQTLRDLQWKLLRRKQDKDKERTLSPSSVNRIMSTASKIFTLACEEGKLDDNPMRFVKMLKEPAPRNRLLSAGEKERLWEELSKDQLLLRLVTLAVNTPLRRGQLLAITPDAVDWSNGLLSARSSKGRAIRIVPLNTTALNTLRLMFADSQLPFPITDFRRRWRPALIAAGINQPDGKRGDNFTFHDLRKEFASELLRRNVNPEMINQLFAHSTMQITQAYMHSELADQTAAVRELDPKIQESEVVQ
jgi:integrase